MKDPQSQAVVAQQIMLFLFLTLWSTHPSAQAGQIETAIYTGMDGHLPSSAHLRFGVLRDSRKIHWDSAPLQRPLYWGIRKTYWVGQAENLGIGIELIHGKAKAKLDLTSDPSFYRLEFSHGHNLVLFPVLFKIPFSTAARLSLITGLGLGLAIPHVEITLRTQPPLSISEYQVTGPAGSAMVGLQYRLSPHWSFTIEVKLTLSSHSIDLHYSETSQMTGSFRTQIRSAHGAAGITYVL